LDLEIRNLVKESQRGKGTNIVTRSVGSPLKKKLHLGGRGERGLGRKRCKKEGFTDRKTVSSPTAEIRIQSDHNSNGSWRSRWWEEILELGERLDRRMGEGGSSDQKGRLPFGIRWGGKRTSQGKGHPGDYLCRFRRKAPTQHIDRVENIGSRAKRNAL